MKKKIKIGVIPAAGAGKRLGYLSALLPKTLLPLYDRPIIHYVVNQMRGLGVEDVYIIVNVHKDKIINYLRSVEIDLRLKIHFVEQRELDGTANAILLTEKFIKDQPFWVIYGDDCTITDSLQPMVDLFFESKAVVAEGVVKEKDIKVLQQTCSVSLDKDGKIIEIVEKPENPLYMLRGCGVYIFSPEIFDFIRKTPVHPIRKEKEITYTIDMLASEGRACGLVINGYNININDYNGLLEASILVRENLDKRQDDI